MRRLWLVGLALLTACSDALEKTSPAGQAIAVLSAATGGVTLVNAGDFAASSLGATPDSTHPVDLAGRGGVLVVPQWSTDALKVFNFGSNPSLPLAAGSAPTGAAFQNDTLVWVASTGLDRIVQVNLRAADTVRSLAAGPRPVAVAVVGGKVFAVNANARRDTVFGPSTLTVWHVDGSGAPDTVALTGTNARYITVGDDSLLYVVERGAAGSGDGRLSIVDPASERELVVLNGLGELPGAPVYHPSGRVLVASLADGILEVNALTRSLTRGPGAGVKPGGLGVAAVALDSRGRVYAVTSGGCGANGAVHVLTNPPDYHDLRTVAVGLCPSAATAVLPPIP
ncbi:MAG TPA: hypothetical protein VI160_02165 [Gemmatimonadales bacterium]